MPDDRRLEDLRQWVALWEKAGPKLERIRREELARTDTARSIEALEDAFQFALKRDPPKPYSGLADQQRWYQRLWAGAQNLSHRHPGTLLRGTQG